MLRSECVAVMAPMFSVEVLYLSLSNRPSSNETSNGVALSILTLAREVLAIEASILRSLDKKSVWNCADAVWSCYQACNSETGEDANLGRCSASSSNG